MADRQAEAAWEAYCRRIYPEAAFTYEFKRGFLCGWEEATGAREATIESYDWRLTELTEAAQAVVYGVGRHVASGDMERLARLVP